jgi:hypothetical protein
MVEADSCSAGQGMVGLRATLTPLCGRRIDTVQFFTPNWFNIHFSIITHPLLTLRQNLNAGFPHCLRIMADKVMKLSKNPRFLSSTECERIASVMDVTKWLKIGV